MEILENFPLSSYTYYKIGGAARFYAKPETFKDLAVLTEFIHKNKVPVFIMGAGSNILLSDAGFDGLVVHTTNLNKDLKHHFENEKAFINSGASTTVIQVLRLCMSEGIGGLDYLTGIPGNMGGVFYMNAGTNTGEIKDSITEFTTYNLHSGIGRTVTDDHFNFSYRRNNTVQEGEVILSGIIEGKRSSPEHVQGVITKLLEKRKASQPIDKPSCGSVFKNPEGQQAWKLISDAGLRGRRVGNAQISEMHTNFIVNLGGAKAEDVLSLIQIIKEEVFKQSRVELKEEVRLVGFK